MNSVPEDLTGFRFRLVVLRDRAPRQHGRGSRVHATHDAMPQARRHRCPHD
jgi:hypothetical protein